MQTAKIQISLGIRPVWSESSLSAWRKLGPLAIHWVHSEDSDQPGRMPRLIWVFAARTVILLVLSWGGSYVPENYLANRSCLRRQLLFSYLAMLWQFIITNKGTCFRNRPTPENANFVTITIVAFSLPSL